MNLSTLASEYNAVNLSLSLFLKTSISLFESFIHPWHCSHLSLYVLYKGLHFISWSQLLIRVNKFEFLYQIATVFSSIYEHLYKDLSNLLNSHKSQTEFIFPANTFSSLMLIIWKLHHPSTYEIPNLRLSVALQSYHHTSV